MARPRTFTSWVAAAIMGLLVLVFLLLGVGAPGGASLTDIFAGARGDAAIVAGQHVVTGVQFKQIWEQQKRRIDEQQGATVPPEELAKAGFDRQFLEQMGQERAFSEMLRRAGVAPGHAVVDAEIKKLPFAFDRITGKFSPEQYTRYLQGIGLTPRDAQEQVTDELASRHFTYAVAGGMRLPRIFSAMNVIQALEQRDATFFVVGQNAVPPPTKPTDAQLMAFIKENAARLTTPETRVITLVRLSARALEPTMTVDPAALQKEFDFKKDSLSQPATRSLIQIPVKTAAQGTEAAARLSRGEDPAVIAKAYGTEPVTYVDKPRSAIADAKLAAAVFTLAEGEARGPIAGTLGLSAVLVTKVTQGVPATLEAARPQLEAELRRKAAEDRVYELSQKFDDARQGGDGIAAAAAKAGITAVTVGPVTAQGAQISDGQRNALLDDKLLKEAFAEAQGYESDLTDAGPGEYYALRVERVIPPSLPSIDERRNDLTLLYMRTRFMEALRAKVDGLVERVKKGESMEAVAATVGGHVTHQLGLQRISAQQHMQTLGQDFLQRTFTAKPGETFSAGGATGFYVIRLDAVRPGEVETMARFTEQLRPRVAQQFAQEFAGLTRTAATGLVKVITNLPLARREMGITADMLPKTEPAKGAKPKPGELVGKPK